MSRQAYVDLIRYLARSTLRAGLLALLLMAALVGVGAALHGLGQPAAWPPGVGGSPGYQGGTCYVGGQLCITWPNAAEDHPFTEISFGEYPPVVRVPPSATCRPPHRPPCPSAGLAPGGGSGSGP